MPPSLRCLRLKSRKRLKIVSVVKKKKENEGYKAHSERNDKTGLESALPKNWGLRRTLKKDGRW